MSVFFSGAVRRAGGFFFGAEKSTVAIFFSRKENQIIFGYTFFYRKVFLDQIQRTVFG